MKSPCKREEVPMLYAILAYHVEAHVMSWTPDEDAALMADLQRACPSPGEREGAAWARGAFGGDK